MERRFVIREIYEGEAPTSIHWFTESELKRRLSILQYEWASWSAPMPWDDAIDVLLHGEQPCYICHRTGGHESWCSRGKEQPDFARGFQKGVDAMARKNKSGCCCIIDDSERVIEPCLAHANWAREYCKQPEDADKSNKWHMGK